VRLPGLVSPGETAELTMSLENESPRATSEMSLYSSELVSSEGHRIPAELVQFEPPKFRVPPRSTGEVTIRVRIPKDTPSGTYEGLLRAGHLETLRAVIRVQVR